VHSQLTFALSGDDCKAVVLQHCSTRLLLYNFLTTPLQTNIRQHHLKRATAAMLAGNSSTTISAPSKHDTAKKWLHNRLWKPASRQFLRSDGDGGVRGKFSVERPQTAPSSGREAPNTVPPVPQIPIMELPSPRLAVYPPARPPRPDSGMIRDVNAWLDASSNAPPPQLMSGLPYWRSTSTLAPTTAPGMQFAIPIVREPEPSRPLTPSGQQMKSMCRRGAKKVQAKMPSLLRTTSQRAAACKHVNRRSASMPLLAIAYEQTRQAAPPKNLTRSRSSLLASARTSGSKSPTEEQALLSTGQPSGELPVLGSTRMGVAFSGGERRTDRRRNATLRQMTRSGESTRPSTAGAYLSQDGSMNDLSLSEVPTYSSGPAPPSYCSRTVSVRTTSSFGCVDGISASQRQISQQRAAMRNRGVRGRVRELRKIFQGE
ncbi:hypothetical protein C7974DRAFT_453902, partial [Boeremia exigua]|uniref:uncharacterized protein n=1 Tax=Boeremia exigua TaxID=749465 RepID=UPI001E8CE06D